MSTFLTGRELENKLTDIIWDAKKYIIIISPFIKLDEHVKSIFEKIKSTHDVSLFVVFGKNEEYKHKSFNDDDFNFIKEFKNVTILYNKDLHAKHYCNEKEGLITSLNLYGYSMVNNIEYGVLFSKSLLNPMDKLFEETENFNYELVFEKSQVVYLKKPQYSKKLFGLTRQYEQSKIMFDISNAFFNNRRYESKYLKDFDLDIETSIEKKFGEKPQREEPVNGQKMGINWPNQIKVNTSRINTGYCIRTGVEIPFNPEQPMCKSAWQTWNRFGDFYYPESYCHKTGKPSYGKTSMAHPIL
ncbi:phospholipase D family protein [Flavobacteriaceae bacterium LMO-SS05]